MALNEKEKQARLKNLRLTASRCKIELPLMEKSNNCYCIQMGTKNADGNDTSNISVYDNEHELVQRLLKEIRQTGEVRLTVSKIERNV